MNPTAERMERGFSQEQIDAEKIAKDFKWNARERPATYNPVQLSDTKSIPASCLDWWNTRSPLICCLFPCAGCLAGTSNFDATDPSVWENQLKDTNPKVPESMRGVWWLKDNVAHENLVTIFSDATLVGTFNEEGTDGYGTWARSLKSNWSRDRTCFGYVLGISGNLGGREVTGLMNLKDGMLTLNSGLGPGAQIIYKINDNEWWKVHYLGNPGEEGDQEINYVYKWVKVLDKDCNKTEHWNDYEEYTNAPLPHTNCGTSWLPCWPICLPANKARTNMTYPNKTQIVNTLR